MTATSHAIIGTIIAAKIGNPILAVPIAFASHIAADMIPHWDTATNKNGKSFRKLFIHSLSDVVLGFVLSYILIVYLFPKTDLAYAFILILASQALDWLTAPYYFFRIKAFERIYKFQKSFDKEKGLPWGLVNQIIFLIALVALAKTF